MIQVENGLFTAAWECYAVGMKMKTGSVGALMVAGVLASAGVLQAADGDAAARAATAAMEQFDADTEAWREKLREAAEAERQAIYGERPDPAPALEKVREFIKEFPEHAKVPAASGWLILKGRGRENPTMVYDALATHHLDSPDLAPATLSALYDTTQDGEKFLDLVLEKAGDPQAKGAAAYVRAYRLRRSRNADPEKRLEYLRLAVKHLGDLEVRGRSLKAMAEGQIFAAENLAIGKVAPEIEGEDTDGVKFKLSDYRGKVVVIDFWGHW